MHTKYTNGEIWKVAYPILDQSDYGTALSV